MELSDKSVTQTSLTIENATQLKFESITINTNSNFEIYSMQHVDTPQCKTVFSFPAKTNTPCFVSIQINPIVSLYQRGIECISAQIPEFTIQILGNTTIRLVLLKNIFGIKRSFIIENKTENEYTALASGSLIEYSASGTQIYIIPPTKLALFNVFMPLSMADFKVSRHNSFKLGTCFLNKIDANKSFDLATFYPLTGDSYKLIIQD